MIEFPEAALRIIEDAARRNPNDIPAACEAAERNLRRRPALFAEFEPLAIKKALQELAYEVRDLDNQSIKRAAGYYHTTPKVATSSPAVEEGYRAGLTVFDYRIGGKTLGDLKGEELEPLANTQDAIAAGMQWDAETLRWLRAQVPDGATVRERVGRRKLEAWFKRRPPEMGAAAREG